MDKAAKTIPIDFLHHAKEAMKKYEHIFWCIDCSYYFSPTKMADSPDSLNPGEYCYSVRSGYSAKCPHCGKCLRDLKNREITQEAVVDMVIRNLGPIFIDGSSSADYWRGKCDAYREMNEKKEDRPG